MVQEFKDFINRGNLVDIAVAFVMGIAFAAVITSLTNDVINPIIAKIFDVQDLAEWIVWDIRIGAFLAAIINFLIVALVMFFVVKAYNRMRRADEADDEPSEDILAAQGDSGRDQGPLGNPHSCLVDFRAMPGIMQSMVPKSTGQSRVPAGSFDTTPPWGPRHVPPVDNRRGGVLWLRNGQQAPGPRAPPGQRGLRSTHSSPVSRSRA